jgi:hypothetical protein
MATHNLFTLSNSSSILLSRYGTHSGADVTIQNVNASGYIYLGGNSSVSSTNYGFRILPNHSISFELPGSDSIYAISSEDAMKAAVFITNLESGS